MHITRHKEISYEILDYESKLLQIRTSPFRRFPWMAPVQFSMKIYVNKATLLIFDYLTGKNIFQIVFDFITYLMVNQWKNFFSKESLTFSSSSFAC